METPTIRYNLKRRGRHHTGQSRNFNIQAICDTINSPACQEMVASRGMIGYYGHLPRIRYGLDPVEGGIEGGKYTPVEPAIVTTYLKADYDGNIEHRSEFLDTASGRLAAKLWEQKVGGFSSAIDQAKNKFYGYDYVANPNYLDNSFRGVALDDAYSGDIGELLTYDDVYAAEQEEKLQATIMLLDSLASERKIASETIEHLRAENEELLSMLAAKGINPAALDSSMMTAPLVVSGGGFDRIMRDTNAFRGAALLGFIEPNPDNKTSADNDPVYRRILAKFGR